MIENQPKIAVITVNWNRPSLTIECYESLLTSIEVDWHLFVVDNGSTDDSRTILAELGPRATFLETGVNSGWAGGNNVGIDKAMQEGYEWFFLLNNDATVSPTTIKELWKQSSAGENGPAVTGAIQLDEDESACFFGEVATGDILSNRPVTRAEYENMPYAYPTPFIKGAALFGNKKHFEIIGLFEEKYFLNFEEAEWCLRAFRAGFEVMMVKSAEIRHGGSGSMGGISSPMSTYFLVRNQLLFAERNGGPWAVVRAIASRLDWARHEFKTKYRAVAAYRAVRSKSPWATSWKLGMRDYFIRRFGDCPTAIRTLTYGNRIISN